MIRGTKFKPKKSDIIDALSDKMGKVSAVAEHFGVSRDTIYAYMRNNPDVQQELERIRDENEEMDLDNAEALVRATMTVKDNPRLRFDAAKYVLDKKGGKRKWGETKQESDVRGLVQDKISNEISVVYQKDVKNDVKH